ncbi:hypothetical protein SLS60_012015 [Paraconiothyrium brasiliense]|uniref:Uncharacterized protein n=1 Tax=Paraconiothyrium brasiliense TaxID=300254 RepID=A0ABR3QHS5_9PLEO
MLSIPGAGHGYFNTMLDDVLQLLKGYLAIRPLARRGIKESNNEASTFVTQGGLFDTLDVEDVSDGAGVVNVEETIPNKPTLDET